MRLILTVIGLALAAYGGLALGALMGWATARFFEFSAVLTIGLIVLGAYLGLMAASAVAILIDEDRRHQVEHPPR